MRPGTRASPSRASVHGMQPMRVRCSARIGVKVAGMCWVSTTGTGSERPSPCTRVNSACGPPVELPTASSRARQRRRRAQRQAIRRAGCAHAPPLAGQALDLLQQLPPEAVVADGADAGRLGDVVGRAQPQRAQRDVGAARGQGGGHDHLHPDRRAAAGAARSCRPSPASRCPAPPHRPRAPRIAFTASWPFAALATTSISGSASSMRAMAPRITGGIVAQPCTRARRRVAVTAGRPGRTCRSGCPRRTAS